MIKINEILWILEVFQYSMSLDLNIGYYYIQCRENPSHLCTVILPWENIITNVYQQEFLIHQTFPTENESFIPWILIYPCVHK